MEGAEVKVTEGVAGAVGPPPDVREECVRPAEGQQNATVEADQVVLRLGDFIKRIPPNLLKSSELDLNRTLRFDLGDLSECVNEGISTVPLALLVKAIPHIFIDDIRDQQITEIRFPWARVLEIIRNPLAASDGNDGHSILLSLQSHCTNEVESQTRTDVDRLNETPGPSAAPPSERRESGRTNVWFSRKKGAKGEGTVAWKSESGPLATGPMGGDAKQGKGEAPPALQDGKPQNDPSEGALMKLPATSEPAARCKVSPIAQAVRIAELEKQLKEVSTRYLGEIATLRAEISRGASPAREEDESELSQVSAELAELQSEYQWVLEESARAREEAVARVVVECDGRIREKEVAIKERDARLAEMTREHEAAVQVLREEFEGKLRVLKPGAAPGEPRIADLRSEHQRALEESTPAREEAVAGIAAERDGLIREKEAAAKEHEARLAGISAELESLRAHSNTRREDADRLLEYLQREHLHASASERRELEHLQAEHQQTLGHLTTLRTQLDQYREALEEQTTRLREAGVEKAEAIARLEAEHEWDIGQIVLEMQKNLSALHPAIPAE
jgi:hypothetical protein